MVDASARFAAAGLAIALGLLAATSLTAESAPAPAELATSDIAAALGRGSLAASSQRSPQTVGLDAEAASAVCRGTARAALLARPLTTDEAGACRAGGRRIRQEPVAFVAAAIAVPIGDDFVDALSIEQLRRVFGRAASERLSFRDLDPRWPDLEVVALGVGASRGAHETLRRALGDATPIAFSERSSDAEVAAAIEATPGAIGFLGATEPGALAHALRLIPVRDHELRPVYPTRDALEAGEYALGATIWLIADASTDGRGAPLDPLKEAIAQVASAADCLAFVERRPAKRLAAR